ncbi:hypothetical 14.3 kDa protein (plasmid) [Sinorhizobium fredii NGR234]|uniref:Uncharacterized protein y4lK n=1 Tax=Sinorhizobium fredii (strain NBRC 101917 / NGR234) TaxID=394 RepID=Y4LK_SINFN|nr:RecName: Full=Uncharacterized protein y4lK [Sinorhizobium fredii NGR234]AAB91763.1 hypothetical 14.3 kDa protein [Sinorhizobium fredii NGR234]
MKGRECARNEASRSWFGACSFASLPDQAVPACSLGSGEIPMAHGTKQKLMKASDIPAFVNEVIEAGCDICAVGHEKYVIGDTDLSRGAYGKMRQRLGRIEEAYGDRDFLKLEIVAYLRSIGRYVDVGADGSE